ncbi:hypothetical protein B0O99DRAFT_642724 [Bisporella sp. PMI_857]|nr:hypothetical protein B0O99DRAFT_642724 [Bisporella sp. PMI_857]
MDGGFVDAAARDVTMLNGDPKKFGESMVEMVEERGLFENIWVCESSLARIATLCLVRS